MSALRVNWLLASRGRGSRGRSIGIAAGVAVGVALLLLIMAAYHGLSQRGERGNWMQPYGTVVETGVTPQLADDVALAVAGHDFFEGQQIMRLDLATTPNSSVTVPGVGAPPRPGEYFASPALAALIAAHEPAELQQRYGTPAGLIPPAALATPTDLAVVVGATPTDPQFATYAVQVTELSGYAYPSESYRIVAIVGGIAVLFPVLLLIVIVTRLGQTARTERLATLRLIGAGPRRIAAIAALEIGAPAAWGAVLGVALFWLLRPLAARVPVDGGPFYLSDLTVGATAMVMVPLAVVVAACAVSYVAARVSRIGPLGASRARRERAPHPLSLLPLFLGVLVVCAVTLLRLGGVSLGGQQGLLLLLGFAVLLVGLLWAGPYLTYAVSRIGARRAQRATSLLAMHHMQRHPRTIFRAVSGMVLALFVVSLFAAAMTTERVPPVAHGDAQERVSLAAVVAWLAGNGTAAAPEQEALTAVRSTVTALPGVTGLVEVDWSEQAQSYVVSARDAQLLGLSETSGDAVGIDGNYFGNVQIDTPRPPAALAAAAVDDAVPAILVAMTDGSTTAIETARTALSTAGLPLGSAPQTRGDMHLDASQGWAARYASLAGLGMIIATAISAVSLAVSTAASMLERRRVLGLMRLTGMPASVLRRMIAIETSVPLLAVFGLSIGLGWLAAWALLAGLTRGERGVAWPDASYLVALLLSLGIAALAVLGTFRTVRSELPLSATRFE